MSELTLVLDEIEKYFEVRRGDMVKLSLNKIALRYSYGN